MYLTVLTFLLANDSNYDFLCDQINGKFRGSVQVPYALVQDRKKLIDALSSSDIGQKYINDMSRYKFCVDFEPINTCTFLRDPLFDAANLIVI